MKKKSPKSKVQTIKKKSAKFSVASKIKKIDEATLNEMIKDRAYFIWQERGAPQNQDVDIWVQAEKDVLTQVKK